MEIDEKALEALQRLHAKFGTETIVDEMEYDGPFWARVDYRLHDYDYATIKHHLAQMDNVAQS